MKLRKIAAVFMAVLICISTLAVSVSASSKKSIKLNKTKITMTVDDTYTLKPTLRDIKNAPFNGVRPTLKLLR